MTEAKKTTEETLPDNKTSFFGDPGRFGIGTASGGNGSASSSTDPDGKCCQCSASGDKITLDNKENEQQFRIEIENLIQNRIFVKNS